MDDKLVTVRPEPFDMLRTGSVEGYKGFDKLSRTVS